jgi:D-lactate dehydrogenase (cytochrome)
MEALSLHVSTIQVAMCNFKTIKDAADVAIATMLSGIQVCQL